MSRSYTAACKADAATATAAETGTGAVINHVSRRILSSEQRHHQFVKRYARFRMRCSRCGHHKLIQVVEIVSPPIYEEMSLQLIQSTIMTIANGVITRRLRL